jgi:hypothetical protein
LWCSLSALGTAGVVRYPVGEVRFALVVLMAIHGLYPGSTVVILSGVFERLVRPVVAGTTYLRHGSVMPDIVPGPPYNHRKTDYCRR